MTGRTGVTHSRAPRESTATTVIREIRANARHLLSWQGRGLVHTLASGVQLRIRNRSEWNVYNEVFADGEYDGPIQRVLDAGPAEPWVLDVGGHAGFFALRFADLWLRARGDRRFHVVSIEGSPATAVHLREHLSQAVLQGRCAPHHGLVGTREGVGRISQSIRSSINSIVEPASVRLARVPFLDLETLVPSDARIALLKCDIEGAEELFISSYPELSRRVDLAVFEFHDQLCDVENCRALLHAAGLRTRRLLRVFGVGITIELFER